MKSGGTEKIFSIIESLQQAKISYTLSVNREHAVTILALVPGHYWEIDVYKNGDVEVEVFSSNGEIMDESQLAALITKFSD